MLKGELMEAEQRRRDKTSGVPTKNGTRNILVLGDLHIGSMYGLLPPDFVSCDGSISPWSLWLALDSTRFGTLGGPTRLLPS